ncbi:MAG: C4-type zinc ribbon domain-containing protein [Thermodesulfobacteriota bacterium]|nr:C4-type zinc ribbon domain-containing protein [Thermodesulfobacteriota bacterium]
MQKKLELLVKLQGVDQRISKAYEFRKISPKKIESLKSQLSEYQNKFNSEQEKLELLNKERRKKEIELDDVALKLNKFKSQVNLVKTNKEYKALLKEIEEAEELCSYKEEEILYQMEDQDTMKKSLEKTEKTITEIKGKIEVEKKALEEELNNLENSLKSDIELKELLLEEIDGKILDHYKTLINKKGGIAVVPARNELCCGCFMNIPPQLFNNLKKESDDFFFCPHCHRILYWEGN